MLAEAIMLTALLTGCDNASRCSYVIEFPNMPVTVQGGNEDYVFKQAYDFSLPEEVNCSQARSFIGLDNGDRGEFDIEFRTRSNYHIFERSFHRHINGPFESWYTHYINVTGKDFEVFLLGRVIAKNSETGMLSARYHAGLVLDCKKVSHEGPLSGGSSSSSGQDSDSSSPGGQIKVATDYIPLKDKQLWADKVENSYSVWRGDRDLNFLLANPIAVAKLGFNSDLLQQDISKMAAAHDEQESLVYRILTEVNKDFPDRCQVRKSVALDMLERLNDLTALYASYTLMASKKGVKFGVTFDTFKGWIEAGMPLN